MENEKNVSALDLLLRPELPDVRKVLPEKRVEVTRLSELTGEPAVFTLRALSYNEIRQVQDKPREEDEDAEDTKPTRRIFGELKFGKDYKAEE